MSDDERKGNARFSAARLRREDVVTATGALGEETQALSRLLTGRYSCRAFLPNPVPRAVIESMLQIAQLTPSWGNIQPWQVIVTEGEATSRFAQALHAHALENPMGLDFDFPIPPATYRGVYDERRKESGIQLYASLGIGRGDKARAVAQMAENFRLFGAPHAAIITTERDIGLYGAVDCGVYLTSFMLAAQSLGVATIAQASLARFGGVVRAHFGIPADRAILCGISFGYADEDHPANGFRTTRADWRETAQFFSS